MLLRHARRAVLLTPSGEVLLMRIREPTTGWTAWITPGGGAEPGETPEATLRRELFEETGLGDFATADLVWGRDHTFEWEGRECRQIEEFYRIPVARFEPTAERNPAPIENRAFRGFRWWAVEAIERSPETFVPARLGALLRRLVEEGVPPEPFDAGV